MKHLVAVVAVALLVGLAHQREAVERGQIWGALSGSITDQQLMFEKWRLCGDGACTTWARKFCDSNQEVDG